MHDIQPVNLNALPEKVHAADEDMYYSILLAICDEQGLDRRFAGGNILDEYHECWFENYEDKDITFPDDDLNERPDSDLIPSQYMVEFARDDLSWYTRHDPEYHEDGDITKPVIVTHETWGDQIECPRCESDRDFAFEDSLIALGANERERLYREYLDQFMPDEMKPYEIRESRSPVQSAHVFHNGEIVGLVQFNESVDNISVPMAYGHTLFDAQQVYFNKPTTDDMRAENMKKYPHLYES